MLRQIIVILLWIDVILFFEFMIEFLLHANKHGFFKALNWADAKRRIPFKYKKRVTRDIKYCSTAAIVLALILLFV